MLGKYKSRSRAVITDYSCAVDAADDARAVGSHAGGHLATARDTYCIR